MLPNFASQKRTRALHKVMVTAIRIANAQEAARQQKEAA
jgi:hypothetical protein